MHKVKTQRSGKLFVKNMLIFKFFYMVIIKNYKVKKLFNKFPEISGYFPGEISGNFRTHNPSCDQYPILGRTDTATNPVHSCLWADPVFSH